MCHVSAHDDTVDKPEAIDDNIGTVFHYDDQIVFQFILTIRFLPEDETIFTTRRSNDNPTRNSDNRNRSTLLLTIGRYFRLLSRGKILSLTVFGMHV